MATVLVESVSDLLNSESNTECTPVLFHIAGIGEIEVELDLGTSIGEVKRLANEACNIDLEHMLVMYNGKPLKDTDTLLCYGINDNAAVQLLFTSNQIPTASTSKQAKTRNPFVAPLNNCLSGKGSQRHSKSPTRSAATPVGALRKRQEFKERVQETLMIFDWDDTVLPSTWIQCQGLRLDESSEVNSWQRAQLAEAAAITAETLRIAKQHGKVVIVTNAERGWIELSCQKFLPTLYPMLENIKVLSARTTYEGPARSSALDWKLKAFEDEITRIFGTDIVKDPSRKKNVVSFGDSVHEREALLRATSQLPNCQSKSLKFCERPDISQIIKQHTLITGCFERLVHHDGNLDLCIRCNGP